MSITAIRLDRETFEAMGIGFSELPLDKPLEMRGIGKTVVLAGPNGAGKSRLLRLLPKLFLKKMTKESRAATQQKFDELSKDVNRHSLRVSGQLPDSPKLRSEIENGTPYYLSNKAELERLNWAMRFSDAMEVEEYPTQIPINFVPKNPKLDSNDGFSRNQTEERAKAYANNPESAHQNASSYVTQIIKAGEKAELLRRRDNVSIASAQESTLHELRLTVKQLLGEGFSFELDVDHEVLVIGGERSFAERLSPGQQILFQLACLLHANRTKLENCIVLMDEPENHLHPAVLVQVVEAIQNNLASGQLWIATHSVPLIAHLLAKDSNCLWYVNSGQVKRAGRSPEKVLESLMGGPQGTKHLHDLTLLPTQYAAIQFLTECLDAPGVVGADIKDPQTNDIAKILRGLSAAKKDSGEKVRVLDFGAGKGRLLATLRESVDVTDWLDYYAYDIDEDNRIDCEREINMTYPGQSQPRWFKDLHDLEAQTEAETFDLVVMCNVLHEVDPSLWSPLFSVSGTLTKLMHEKGQLLIVEDYGIPVGERAHDYGFLLLDDPELCMLFSITQDDRTQGMYLKQISNDVRYKDRLAAHLVSKVCVSRITGQSQRKAIQKLHDRMTDAVRSSLKQNQSRSSEAGRTYARSAQLLANATLWLNAHPN